MGRVARHYEREAGEWFVAIVQLAIFLPVIIAVVAIGMAVLCIVLVWGLAGVATWLISWPIGAASSDRGRSVRAAGGRLLSADPAHALAEFARDVLLLSGKGTGCRSAVCRGSARPCCARRG